MHITGSFAKIFSDDICMYACARRKAREGRYKSPERFSAIIGRDISLDIQRDGVEKEGAARLYGEKRNK